MHLKVPTRYWKLKFFSLILEVSIFSPDLSDFENDNFTLCVICGTNNLLVAPGLHIFYVEVCVSMQAFVLYS